MKVKECLWLEPDCETETNEPDLPQTANFDINENNEFLKLWEEGNEDIE